MKRVGTTVAVVVGFAMVATVAGPLAMSTLAAADEAAANQGPCGFLSADELSVALGAPMAFVRGHATSCTYSAEADGDPLSGLTMITTTGDPLAAGSLLEQARSSISNATEVEVAGTTALQTPAVAGQPGQVSSSLHLFPDDDTWLQLDGYALDEIDIESALIGLGTLLIPRWTGEALMPEPGVPVDPADPGALEDPVTPADPVVPVEPAVDLATIKTLCELWDPGEVEAALRAREVRVDRRANDPMTCSLTARGGGRIKAGLMAALQTNEEPTLTIGGETVGSLYDMLVLAFPGSVATEVGGLDAIMQPAERLARGGWRTAGLFLALDPDRVLWLRVVTPRGADPEAAVRGLALLASEQVLPPGPNVDTGPEPEPDTPTTGTETLGGVIPFPAEILGEPVEITQEATGTQWLDDLAPPTQLRRRLVRALEAQGMSLRDLKLEVARPGSGSALIIAFRVPGADIEPLMKPIFDIMPVTRNAGTVDPAVTGGKRIVPVDDGGNTMYAYPHGDVLWLVLAFTDDDLAAVLQQLP